MWVPPRPSATWPRYDTAFLRAVSGPGNREDTDRQAFAGTPRIAREMLAILMDVLEGLGLFLLQYLGIKFPIAHEKNDAILFRKTLGVVGLATLLVPIGPDRERRVLLTLLGV